MRKRIKDQDDLAARNKTLLVRRFGAGGGSMAAASQEMRHLRARDALLAALPAVANAYAARGVPRALELLELALLAVALALVAGHLLERGLLGVRHGLERFAPIMGDT